MKKTIRAIWLNIDRERSTHAHPQRPAILGGRYRSRERGGRDHVRTDVAYVTARTVHACG